MGRRPDNKIILSCLVCLCLSLSVSLCLSRSLFLSLSLCVSDCLSLCVSLTVCLSHYYLLQLSMRVAKLVSSNLVPVVSLLGVVGNALNVAVFFRQGLRERVNVCLFSLALADLVVCTFYFLLYGYSVVTQFHFFAHPQEVRIPAPVTFFMTKLTGGWH